MRYRLAALLVFAAASASGAQDGTPVDKAAPAPVLPHVICGGDDGATERPQILDGYGGGGFRVTTASPGAQAFFDNGMQLASAFAHKAAIGAFHEAGRLDPACAMCLWGEAWASGPTINYPIERAEADKLAILVLRAQALAATAGTPRERALIAALKLRYAPGKAAAGNIAFAHAMDALALAYPQDKEIAVLTADATLVALGREKREAVARPQVYHAIALLEGVLARDPNYTPAIHFYIHATEIGNVPARATPYADRLAALAPKASHLVHMPSHTYYWVGRYQDAADANRRAVAIGIDNAKRLHMAMPDGVWDLPYHAHNVHFGVGGAMMSGDAATALALSDPLVARAGTRDKGSSYSQMVAAMGYAAEGRFAEPAKVLALPEPKLPYARAYWHYARGEALARRGDAAAVRAEAAAIPSTFVGKVDDKETADAAVQLTRIARLVLVGRAAMLEHRPGEALAAFRRAAALQEDKRLHDFSDPPLWWYPVRRSVAEARLAAGDAAGALAEADATLKMRPLDPVTLAVRADAEAALGHAAGARQAKLAALHLWRGARAAFAPAQI